LYSAEKQVIMRPGRDHRTGCEQAMVLPDGQPKRTKMILQERGLWDEGLLVQCKDVLDSSRLNPDCLQGCDLCAHRRLAMEPDFRAQKYCVEEGIVNHGHLVTFLTKYHPSSTQLSTSGADRRSTPARTGNIHFLLLASWFPTVLSKKL
jgi:hypothetical protein